jgi:UDP-N-acetylmuramate: L-alanyl-gamma-D-glutamyl-meso-diaminopimelate ligase
VELKKGSHIYFMGIGGTGMAAVAGLCQQAGYVVSGSDKGVYPPTSTMLKELKIPFTSPYQLENLKKAAPDLVVVANALSRGNPEVEFMLEQGMNYTSFPKFLGDYFLKQTNSIVVAGTHGKTTTTALLAYVLTSLGTDPSYMIGGIPRDLPRSFHIGSGKFFAIEGDEYDTAFFDKGSKFLHYHPKYLILNNLEFDHADIFKDLDQIEQQFIKVAALVSNKKHIIANVDDPGIVNLLKKARLDSQVTRVSTLGLTPTADVVLVGKPAAEGVAFHKQSWTATIATKTFGSLTIQTPLSGAHNIANITQAVALIEILHNEKLLPPSFKSQDLITGIRDFSGVERRLDHLGAVQGIDIYEDFAHHPTAIKLVIGGFRAAFPKRRLVVAFEPANATGRRNVLLTDFSSSLALADTVFIGNCPVDERIPANERMDTKLMEKNIGPKARAFHDNESLLDFAVQAVQPGDAIIFMSSSSFSGVQYRLQEKLSLRFGESP